MDFTLNQEQKELVGLAQSFAKEQLRPLVRTREEHGEIEPQLMLKLHELGFLTMGLSESRGGLGLSVLDQLLVLKELAHGDSAVAFMLAQHNVAGLYALEALLHTSKMSSEHTKIEELFSSVYKQTLIVPNFKSRGSMERWVSSYSSLFVFLFQDDDDSISCVPFESFSSVEDKGLFFKSLATKFGTDDVLKSKASWSLPCSKEFVREVKMRITLAHAAIALGVAEQALADGLAYADTRVQFGQAIVQFQATQWKLANASTELESAKLLLLDVASKIEQNNSNELFERANFSHILALRTVLSVSQDALQIFGGNGFVKEYPAERAYRDAAFLRSCI